MGHKRVELYDEPNGYCDMVMVYRGKPGRKKYWAGLHLSTRRDIELTLEMVRQMRTMKHADNPDCELLDHTIKYFMRLLAALDLENIVIEDATCAHSRIHTTAARIDDKEAVRMAAALMKVRGYENVKVVRR